MQLRDHPAKVGRIDGIKLPPASIKIDSRHNIRDMASPSTREHIEELKLSIKAVGGVQKPIQVRMVGNDPVVTDGECRVTAVMELIRDEGFPIESMVCILEPGGTDEIERILNFGAAGTSQRYTELELAEWCRRLDRLGVAHEKIAATAGWKSKASVKQHLDMLEKMPEPVKQMVRDSEVSASLAMKMLKEEPEKCAELLRANKEENKRLGVSARMKHKVTPKTIQRDRPKPQEPKHAPIIPTETPPVADAAAAPLPGVSTDRILPDRVGTMGAASDVDLASPPATPQGEGATAAPEVSPSVSSVPPVAHIDLLPILALLTKHAKHVLEANQFDGHYAGAFWLLNFEEAIGAAKRLIARCLSGADPYDEWRRSLRARREH